MLVLKFGGSSVGSVEALSSLKNIVENKAEECVVVVSAMSEVTDKLSQAFELSFSKGLGYENIVSELEYRHCDMVKSIVPLEKQDSCICDIKKIVSYLNNILSCIAVLKESSERSKDFVLTFGELLSSRIVVDVLNDACFIDARDMIVTDDNFGSAKILWEESKENVRNICLKNKGLKVVNGFCGKTKDGYSSTLGRGGSDLSVLLIEKALS